jgi:outer membrane protein OmpA-like peptidoglycan-associated protein
VPRIRVTSARPRSTPWRNIAVCDCAFLIVACTTAPPSQSPLYHDPAPDSSGRGSVADVESDATTEVRDSDRDQVDDAHDLCPQTVETYNGFKDDDGCPDPEHDAKQLWISVTFEQRSTAIETIPTNEGVIADVARLLESRPDMTLVEVGGHADGNEGKSRKQLGQARANAVRLALISKGVSKDRLVARGYGSDCPRTAGLTDADRSRNREITFRILQNSDGTVPPRSCP